jgi:hypothetical protein
MMYYNSVVFVGFSSLPETVPHNRNAAQYELFFDNKRLDILQNCTEVMTGIIL